MSQIIEVPFIVRGKEGQAAYTRKEAAEILGLKPNTLNNYVQRGNGPVGYKLAASHTAPVLYFRDDLIRWKNEVMGSTDTRHGRGRAENFGYVNPMGVSTRRHSG